MAAFASKASRSNSNVLSPEGLAHGPSELSSPFVTQPRPVSLLHNGSFIDGDENPLVVSNASERFNEFEHVPFCNVLSFDRLVHVNRILTMQGAGDLFQWERRR